MKLEDHVILNFNNMSTTAVFLDIGKAFDTTWRPGLQQSELERSTSLIKWISSFLTKRKFKALVEGEFSTPREIAAGVPQGSILAPILCSPHKNDRPAAARTHLFADDTCIYASEEHDNHVLCKLQPGLSVVYSWCEPWNTTIDEEKTQAI
jgi:hypothetical protein